MLRNVSCRYIEYFLYSFVMQLVDNALRPALYKVSIKRSMPRRPLRGAALSCFGFARVSTPLARRSPARLQDALVPLSMIRWVVCSFVSLSGRQ